MATFMFDSGLSSTAEALAFQLVCKLAVTVWMRSVHTVFYYDSILVS